MAKVNPLMSRSLTPPPGWTIDPEELDEEEDWVAEDGLGRHIAEMHGLQQCTPIMCEVIGSGGGGVLFESAGKIYLLDQLGGDLYHLNPPKTLEQIVSIMKGTGRGVLNWKHLQARG